MKLWRLVASMLAAAFGTVAGPCAAADDAWPSRPITMVNQYVVGGVVDVLGRILAEKMPAVLTQSLAATGKYKVLAFTGAARSKSLPEVPTFQEPGYGEAALSPWFTLMVPSRTPPAIIARIEESMRKAVASPDVVARMEGAGAQPLFRNHSDTVAMVKQEVERWHEVVKATGIQAN